MEHKTIQNRDIVLFGFMAWDGPIASNFKEMAFELSRYNRVLYVNRAMDRATLARNKNTPKKDPKNKIEKVSDSLWVLHPSTVMESINWIPINFIYDILSRANTKKLAKEIRETMTTLEFRNTILINDNDFFRGHGMKELLNSTDHIFYIRDYLTYQPWFRRHGPRMEKKLLEQADLVVANSTYLANYARKFNKLSFDIGQGCELDNYMVDDLPQPEDVGSIPRPIIGYTGAISGTRLDADVIAHIASNIPEVSVVLVGPLSDNFPGESLKQYSNVHFLGSKPPSTIPNYVFQFDVCMNPQQVNQLTIGNYPRKADEYLAMGKPMVATETEAMEMFRDHVFLCRTKDDYVTNIRNILKNKELQNGEAKSRRQEFAQSHSWQESIGRMGDAYFAYKNERNEFEQKKP